MATERCWYCNWHSKYITPRERKAARPRKQIVQQLQQSRQMKESPASNYLRIVKVKEQQNESSK